MREYYFNIPTAELDEVLSHTQIWSELKDQHLLITGGTGFFGRWILASILRANDTLKLNIHATVITRAPKGFVQAFPEAHDKCFNFKYGDLRYTLLPVANYSHVLHLATDSIANQPAAHLGLTDSVITGTRRVLDHVANCCPQAKVLYVSSGAVYGPLPDGEIHTPETYTGAPPPESPQAFMSSAKRMAEQLCSLYSNTKGLDVKIARCFSFAGPHMPMQSYFAFGNFIHDAVQDKPIAINGDGTPIRAYLYAGDLTAWLWTILDKGEPCRPYNVGSDQQINLKELATTISSLISDEGSVKVTSKVTGAAPSRYVPDISRATNELGLSAWTDLQSTILRTAHWYQSFGETLVERDQNSPRTLVMDIDGVIANIAPDNDYNLSTPRQHNIEKLNRLYDAGHKIILFTARGYVTGIDWREVTEQQMERWGVKYHELHLGKPAADIYVDDRMVPLEMFPSLAE
ncbi:NAD-dependent epimerase/dehydratase family protein [Neptuniibacter halophilus]|uniref:NAD-dependent epimerase/dehydratase family protein n=1 Tax=Neptuniibacter halophilus TaxID=651666 RepID=UPI002572E96B|nr:NAD-dependent epimerase/dehydratase family protein [Neptuniibacter halophilus]